MRTPLWADVHLGHPVAGNATVTISLAVCRNCGKPKLTSDPCGFDHLAAILEWKAANS